MALRIVSLFTNNIMCSINTHTHTVCWQRSHRDRPSFQQIMVALRTMESSQFFMSTSHKEFQDMQTTWKEEIMAKFLEQRKLEKVGKLMQLYVCPFSTTFN